MNVHYDQKNGLGQTPYNANIDYRGFKCWMYPQMFLRLAKRIFIDPQDPSYLFLKAAIKRGKPIGSPFFEATWNESQPVWEIDSHEGRHRMQAIHDLWPNEMVEVHIFPHGGLRAKDITPQMAQSFMQGVFAEDSTFVSNPTAKIVAAGKTYTPQQAQQSPVMEAQKKTLNEIGSDSKSYPFKFVRGTKNRVDYEFESPEGKFEVTAVQHGPDIVRVDFGAKQGPVLYRAKNAASVFRIYTTIYNIIKDIIHRSNPPIFLFTNWGPTRAKIVKKLAEKVKGYTTISHNTIVISYKTKDPNAKMKADQLLQFFKDQYQYE